MESFLKFMDSTKLYFGVIFVQFGYAGMTILTKSVLDKGMSPYIFVVYRQVVATLVIAPFAIIFERKTRTKMTFPLFFKILILGLLEPVIDQNLFYTGMKYTTATFAAAMCNCLPAFVFLMSWACRLEKVNIMKKGSQAKMVGTIVTIGGAMIMTFIKGPMLNLPWTKLPNHPSSSSSSVASLNHQNQIMGFLMITTGCICWSAFITLQAITLKSYPAELSLTALICLVGTIGDSVVALVMERGNPSSWALHFDSKLLAVVYSGVICSGVTYYIQGVVMQTKGPVFFTAFNPLAMVLVVIMSSFILSEIMVLGRIIGIVIIISGLYLVLWGKTKDQPSILKSEFDNITPCEQQMITAKDEASKTTTTTTVLPSQEFVALDVAKETN